MYLVYAYVPVVDRVPDVAILAVIMVTAVVIALQVIIVRNFSLLMNSDRKRQGTPSILTRRSSGVVALPQDMSCMYIFMMFHLREKKNLAPGFRVEMPGTKMLRFILRQL